LNPSSSEGHVKVPKTNPRPPPERIWPLSYTLSTPVLAHLFPTKTTAQSTHLTMPAHRHASTARSHAPAGPYKASIIVISSDEDEDPVTPPKHRSRKPRRSRPTPGEVLEILDEPPIKFEEQDTESLRRRCNELQQERDMLQENNRHLSAAMSQLKANTKQNALSNSALDDAICCEVCTHTMWSPYILANCGHTFCQDCLTDWLNTTLGQHRQSGARGFPPYTCPSCRIPVRMPPVQNFSIKRVVRLVAESRGESSPRRPQAPPPPVMVPPPRGRGGVRRDFPSGPFDVFFGR